MEAKSRFARTRKLPATRRFPISAARSRNSSLSRSSNRLPSYGAFRFRVARRTLPPMLDKAFAKWWLGRIRPFRDVAPEKLTAEREAMERQQDYNRNYVDFLKNAVFPGVDALVQV